MNIYKLANVIAVPFFLISVVIAYLGFQDRASNLLVWTLVPLIPLVLIYLFSPQINYWWLSRNPVELDPKVKKMLATTNPIYSQLNEEQVKEFDKRLLLFTEGKNFTAKGMEEDKEDIPIDIKNLISQIPITMTLQRREFLFKHYDRFILYKHPFPSPKYQFLHTMETHSEDGAIIFSLEHIEAAMFHKGHYYNIAWHAFAEAFISIYPKEAYPNIPNNIWTHIENISPQPKKVILATLGFESVDPMPVLINLYFNEREHFLRELPEIAAAFKSIFEQIA